ncbi:hypothetical protein ACIA5C_09320 [Actinoplanes sp. NPDC051343]|uniref:hypothetical protein n=1 Tax=Actinoplanes sp. NPDC051343 TaxID=3363906 RepID=UPI0037A77D5B
MSEFSVDAAGLSGLSRLLSRASDDAFDVLDYTKRQCGLDWRAEGLLMKLVGPHEHAYQSVTAALARVQDLSAGAAGQVALAAQDYAAADLAAAWRLAPAYPEKPAPEDFADVADPGSHLTDPGVVGTAEMWSINPLTDLISPASWLRQVSVSLFGYDPFDEWARDLGGDWAAYVHSGAAMSRAGAGAYEIGRNLLAGVGRADAVWRGSAADAERRFQTSLGTATEELDGACQEFARLYGEAADAAANLRDVAGDLISDLLDALIMVNLASAVGTALVETGIGAVAGYGIAAYYATQAYQLYQEIARCYSIAGDTVEALSAAIGSVHADVDMPDLGAVQPYRYAA